MKYIETRATSHTRLRARDHYTSSTLIGGKGGAGPSSIHTTLEGPMKYVKARWMWSLHGFRHGIKWIMFHGHLGYFQKLSLGDRPNTKLGDHGTPNPHNRRFILFYHVWGHAWIGIHWNSIWLRTRSHVTSHYTWGSVTTLRDVGGVLGRPLYTFFGALTISWSRLLAHVWSGPACSSFFYQLNCVLHIASASWPKKSISFLLHVGPDTISFKPYVHILITSLHGVGLVEFGSFRVRSNFILLSLEFKW